MESIYDNISPLDYRYKHPELNSYLTESAYIQYKLEVELALVTALYERNMCSHDVLQEVKRAVSQVTPQEVYDEEQILKHDIRALVNCIRSKVSNEAKPFIHMTATSCDIVDTANAARYKDVMNKVVIPALKDLLQLLVSITEREANTTQIGRTHGQHAVPITFGFTTASYVAKLGANINYLESFTKDLRGKFSGAVGAYNASSIYFFDPEEFEKDVLSHLGLEPATQSTQIVPLEPMIRLMSELTITAGIIGQISDDMRHLQRTEIGEVGEEFEANQVGSSTMPQKRNPINFENSKSMWKIVVGKLFTVFQDQISEHQRDLTNSASGRTYPELIAYVYSATKRLTRTMSKIRVDKGNLQKNLDFSGGLILAEPLYIILASLGHPDAHEKVRQITLQAQSTNQTMTEIVFADEELTSYVERMDERQKQILSSPENYTGIAKKKAQKIAQYYKK